MIRLHEVRWRIRVMRYRMAAGFWELVLDTALKRHPGVRGGQLCSYAEKELRLAGWCDPDAFYGDLVPKAVMRAVRLFALEDHSGMSAGLVNGLTSQVCMFKPLTPLTGDDGEWNEVGEGVEQNRRFSEIFREGDKAYWIGGRVFREPSGVTFTSYESRVPITFPWTPVDPEIVDVPDPRETQE